MSLSEGTIGEITMFAGTFAPVGWAFCEGQLLPINQNQALFSVLGTNYGGDGINTFGLPDLRGRFPMHAGQGPGLTNRPLGQKGGTENVTLLTTQMPSHNHGLTQLNTSGLQASVNASAFSVSVDTSALNVEVGVSDEPADSSDGNGKVLSMSKSASTTLVNTDIYSSEAVTGKLGGTKLTGAARATISGTASAAVTGQLSGTTDVSGGNQPHDNMPPFIAIQFIICTQGIYPSRN